MLWRILEVPLLSATYANRKSPIDEVGLGISKEICMKFLNWIDVGFIANELLAAIIIFVVLYSLLPFLMKRVDRI